MNFSRRSGTSLVEILVVIVVFLIGILAIVQIFPGGFKALTATSRNATAIALGRAEIEALKNNADQMPDDIRFVQYVPNGANLLIVDQPERFRNDLGPGGYGSMDGQGNLYDASANLIGNWQFLVGANIGRRIIGEGKPIPTPRLIGPYYGSLLSLQFAPLVFNPQYSNIFVVYGNDMTKRGGDPSQQNIPVRNGTYYYVNNEDDSTAELWLPRNAGKVLHYRIEVSVYTNQPGGRQDYELTADATANTGWEEIPISSLLPSGYTIYGIEYDSVRVERIFDNVDITNSGNFTGDPYEYKLLSQQLGLVLFNPAGYNYYVPGPQGRRNVLTGRVSYDVQDWRIIHDEFRMPEMYPGQYRLAIGSLKVSQELGPDGQPNAGIGVQSPDSTGTLRNADLVLQDTDTGGLYVFQEKTIDPHLTSFTVNKSLGLITFLDYDNDPSNGTQLMLLLPGETTPQIVTVNNRSLRALYMGKNEWAVQVMKPTARFVETWTRPGYGQFYIGGSVQGDNLSGSRIYFAPAEGESVVSLGEVYYFNTNGIEVGPVQLTAKIQTNNLGPERLPYIDMLSYYPDFQSFDYNYISAVKNVKGASAAVRVFWNPNFFLISQDPPTNMDRLDKWMEGWRRSTVETYLQRGY